MNVITLTRDLFEYAAKGLPATPQRQFACRMARRVLEADRDAEQDSESYSRMAIEVAELFAVGKATEEDRETAYLDTDWDYYSDAAYTANATLQDSAYMAATVVYSHLEPQDRGLQLAHLLGMLAR